MLAFDCETDGLLEELTVIHRIAVQNVKTSESMRGNDHGAALTVEDVLRNYGDASSYRADVREATKQLQHAERMTAATT